MGNREFFKVDGTKFTGEETKKMEDVGLKMLLRDLAIQEPTPEFRDLVTNFDFEALRQQSVAFARRSQIDIKNFNFVPTERIFFTASTSPYGFYSHEANAIVLHEGSIRDWCARNNLDWRAFTALIIIHEQAHAVSKTFGIDMEIDNVDSELSDQYNQIWFDFMSLEGVGFQQWEVTEQVGHKKRLFVGWDEGVNEKFARQVFLESIESERGFASQIGADALGQFAVDVKRHSPGLLYGPHVRFVEEIISKLCTKTGNSKEFIWNAILRSKFEGQNLREQDMRELFGIINPNFIDELSVAASDEAMQKLSERVRYDLWKPNK